MVFAVIFHTSQKYNIIDDNTHHNLFSGRISIVAALLALSGIGFYTTFTFFCRNKLDCEEIHSYVVFVPILGYIVLRNLSGRAAPQYIFCIIFGLPITNVISRYFSDSIFIVFCLVRSNISGTVHMSIPHLVGSRSKWCISFAAWFSKPEHLDFFIYFCLCLS